VKVLVTPDIENITFLSSDMAREIKRVLLTH